MERKIVLCQTVGLVGWNQFCTQEVKALSDTLVCLWVFIRRCSKFTCHARARSVRLLILIPCLKCLCLFISLQCGFCVWVCVSVMRSYKISISNCVQCLLPAIKWQFSIDNYIVCVCVCLRASECVFFSPFLFFFSHSIRRQRWEKSHAYHSIEQ